MVKSKVLLVSPTDPESGVQIGYPLGLGIVASIIRNSNREVYMIDTAFTNPDDKLLLEINPDIIGISVNTITYHYGLKINC